MKFIVFTILLAFFAYNSEIHSEELPSRTTEMELQDVLQIVSSIKSNKTANKAESFSKIIEWIDGVSIKVKKISGRDLTEVSKQVVNTPIYALSDHIFSNKKDLRLDYDENVVSMEDGFVLKIGNCNFAHISNSVVFCTGDMHLSHSNNNIIISNGEIGIAHDGSGPSNLGSIIYSKKPIEISHSHSSVILFSPHVNISHVQNSDCINTGKFQSSHGDCRHIEDSSLKEDYTIQSIPGLDVKKPVRKKLDPNIDKVSKDPVQVAEYYCHGIKQLEFVYSRNFIHSSTINRFDKQTSKLEHDLQKEKKKKKILKMLNSLSCENKHVKYDGYNKNKVIVTVGGMGNIKLEKHDKDWKIVKF